MQFASAADGLPSRAQIRRWVAAALEHPAEITVRIVDAEEAQALNQDYRDKAYVPNVLTFEYGEITPGVLGGDVVICAPVVEREAREQGKPLKHHYAHMTIHGVLHLQGYDHIEPRRGRNHGITRSRYTEAVPYPQSLYFLTHHGVRQIVLNRACSSASPTG